MRRTSIVLLSAALAVLPSSLFAAPAQATDQLGIFESQADVGSVTPPGKLAYNDAKHVYSITAAGANLWSTIDGFHFAWKKVSGDVSLTADIAFPESSGNPSPHRKAILMFRQTLDADGVYADAAQHGSGMTALQYRRERGATTQDIELNIATPHRLRLEKRGDTITMFVSNTGEPLHPVGASIKLHLDGTFYAGIGVCSHNKDVTEKAAFSNVELAALTPADPSANTAVYSTLQTISIEDNFRRAIVIASDRAHMEAPNWSRDGKTLIFDREGKLYTVPVEGGTPALLNTGATTRCTGSHGLSPDGKWLAISCAMPDKPEIRTYIIPSSGGEPRLVTENAGAYFHSWSPDGKTIAFTRSSRGSLNISTISVDGGPETALTTGTGISDDPDYSPDGKYLYFNSDRSGSMEIWRMLADGTHPEQVTTDEFMNWTPHPSPDGKSVLILSYDKGTPGHPANKDIALRILNVADGKVRVLVNLVGGSGTDNVPNWAPDSTHVAFVSYQLLPPGDIPPSQ
jgi:Tol biopolymer transport system component